MPAQAAVARETPTGPKATNAFPTTITPHNDPDLSFFETSVQPGGLTLGDAIDTTTMHNTTRRTKDSKTLYDRQDSPIIGAPCWEYTYDEIKALLGVNQWFTITYPDGSQEVDAGEIVSIVPAAHTKDEEFPQYTYTIRWTGINPDDNTEVEPNWWSAQGTDAPIS